MDNLKKLSIGVLLASFFLMAHAPWGQHQVYRQMHMLIMCSKKDSGAFKFTKFVVGYFKEHLPESKARVARAPHEDRIFALLKTDQIPLAILSYTLLDKIFKDKSQISKYLKEETRVLYFFPDMVLISNNHFSKKKSDIIYKSLKKAHGFEKFKQIEFKEKSDFVIPFYNPKDS